ncbi:MAG: hypothetical protein RL291_7 [Pseudomonadota bacterium]
MSSIPVSKRPQVSAAALSSTGDETNNTAKAPGDNPPRELSEIAKQALAEAEERRRKAQNPDNRPPELGGRQGPDPVRYGDWENGGIASDF